MSAVTDWMKQVVFCMCFLELLYQLVPGNSWKKYLKFAGGMIFTLVLLEPVFQITSFVDILSDRTWKMQIMEERKILEESQQELAELQNEQIQKGFCEKMEEQIKELVRYYGGEAEKVTVLSGGENTGEIDRIEIWMKKPVSKELELEKELTRSYALKKEQIMIKTEKEG